MKYKVSIPNYSNMKIFDFETDSFEAGETVRFKLPSITDTTFYINSEQVMVKPDPDVSRGFCFVMPECDVVLDITSNSTMTATGIPDSPMSRMQGFMGMAMMNNLVSTNGQILGNINDYPQVPANPMVSSGASRFCSECGAPNKETSKFCGECGAKLI